MKLDRDMEKVVIHTPYIQVDQFAKWIGLTETGGQIKVLLDEEKVYINGELCHEKRKKLYHETVIDIEGIGSFMICVEEAQE